MYTILLKMTKQIILITKLSRSADSSTDLTQHATFVTYIKLCLYRYITHRYYLIYLSKMYSEI